MSVNTTVSILLGLNSNACIFKYKGWVQCRRLWLAFVLSTYSTMLISLITKYTYFWFIHFFKLIYITDFWFSFQNCLKSQPGSRRTSSSVPRKESAAAIFGQTTASHHRTDADTGLPG